MYIFATITFMITVIIAGGSGTRLWPLSTNTYPKHLLKVNNNTKSLLQNTFKRIKSISSVVYVITDASHSHHVADQLPDLDAEHLIIEPARRGTASCILASLERISRTCKANEPIAFIAADHFVRDIQGFGKSFQAAENIAQKTDRIVLIGIEPDHPAVGFGYIEKGDAYRKDDSAYNVIAFHEKPDFDSARNYIQSGNFLWNCGYFVATPQAFHAAMQEHAQDLAQGLNALKEARSKDAYTAAYLALEDIAIDYALIEKTPDLLVIPAEFDWMDLGSYTDLHKAAPCDETGNHVLGDNIELDCVENCFIENHEDKPLAVVGLADVVVVNSPNGIIVARKDMSKEIGAAAKRIQARKTSAS